MYQLPEVIKSILEYFCLNWRGTQISFYVKSARRVEQDAVLRRDAPTFCSTTARAPQSTLQHGPTETGCQDFAGGNALRRWANDLVLIKLGMRLSQSGCGASNGVGVGPATPIDKLA